MCNNLNIVVINQCFKTTIRCLIQTEAGWEPYSAPQTQMAPPVKSSMRGSHTICMSLSNQGIHCCSGSGYSLITCPHPTHLADHCFSEQRCCLMPAFLTWISSKAFQNRRGEEHPWKGRKNNFHHNHHLPHGCLFSQSVPAPHQVNGWDFATAFI